MTIVPLSAPDEGAKLVALTAPQTDLAQVPEWVKILPRGHVTSRKMDFDVTEESYREITAALSEHGVDLVVDYEHKTLTGDVAPAAGWVKELKLTDDAIMARVEWTDKAREYLRNKEYRYLSPVVHVHPDGRVGGLSSIALTNIPAIDGMYAVVNSAAAVAAENIDNMDKDNKEDNKMDELWAQLLELLGLSPETTPEGALDAVRKIQEAAKAQPDAKAEDQDKVVANSVICGLLGLEPGAKTEEAAAKIVALRADGAQQTAEEMVTLALRDGKITPALKGWALDYAGRDPQGFRAFAAATPQMVPTGKVADDTATLALSARLDPQAKEICEMIGVSADDINKYGGNA